MKSVNSKIRLTLGLKQNIVNKDRLTFVQINNDILVLLTDNQILGKSEKCTNHFSRKRG